MRPFHRPDCTADLTCVDSLCCTWLDFFYSYLLCDSESGDRGIVPAALMALSASAEDAESDMVRVVSREGFQRINY